MSASLVQSLAEDVVIGVALSFDNGFCLSILNLGDELFIYDETKRGQIYLNNEELAFALSCQVAKPVRHMGDGPDYKPRAHPPTMHQSAGPRTTLHVFIPAADTLAMIKRIKEPAPANRRRSQPALPSHHKEEVHDQAVLQSCCCIVPGHAVWLLLDAVGGEDAG